jgi:hypothetical protein
MPTSSALRLGTSSVICALALLVIGCSSQSSEPSSVATRVGVPKSNAPSTKNGGSAARRSVKSTLDPDAKLISLAAKDTTIEDIVAQKAPADGALEGRVAPFETSTWRVKCTLKSVQVMKDGDYYLVMNGQRGGQTVVEVPDPSTVKGSPLESQITAARKQLEEKYHPTKDLKTINDEATVTGVGFLGWGKPSKGAKGRFGSRLLPGTGFDFGKA